MFHDDEYLLFEILGNEDSLNNINRRRRRQLLRSECDPFILEDDEFVRRYRLSKELVMNLLDDLRPMFREPQRQNDLSVKDKVLTALSFYATGSYQRPTGDISAHSMAQQTVSSCIIEVTAAMNSIAMRQKYIVFPQTLQERNLIRTWFYEKFGVPGVMGCVDGSHVAIMRPTEHEERYFCRKQYHSLNVQLICDAKMVIYSVDSSYGGATHDSFIWNNHPVKDFMENLHENTWLLGDSGYPLRTYIMTPVVNAAPNTPEYYYTEKHVTARNTIERAIGVLKARFRCLLLHRTLHYKPEVAANIVNTCVILRNMCIRANLPVEELTTDEVLQEAQQQVQDIVAMEAGSDQEQPAAQALRLGMATRQRLIERLWSARPIL